MQYTNIIWKNGEPYSEMFDDIYYSSNKGEDISGESEFNHVFFKNNGLPERWNKKNNFVIAELGFGSGLNCLLTIREWLKHVAENSHENKCLHYIAIEKYPLAPKTIVDFISRYPELKVFCDELLENYPPAVESSHSRRLFDGKVVIHYKFMDVSEALKNQRLKVDAWYLDGFSPAKNDQMWSESLFLKLAQNSHDRTTCSTYTAAGYVKRNLINAGFKVSKVAGYGKKRDMLIAAYQGHVNRSLKYKDKPWFQNVNTAVVKNKKATVIGAGIAGLSVAHALIKRGWWVTIIDREEDVAKATSSNPVAIVYPRLSVNNKVDTDFYVAAYCYAVYELNRLQQASQEKFWFDTGVLQSYDKTRITEIVNQFQFNEEFLSVGQALIDNSADAGEQVFVELKKAGVVLPKVLCDLLKDECKAKLTFKQANVTEIKSINGHWQCLSKTELVEKSEVLIMANGAAINEIESLLQFPVEKVRGQVIALAEKACSKRLGQTINANVYLTPFINGAHHLGASYSRENYSAVIDDEESKSLLAKLANGDGNVINVEEFSQGDIVDAWVGFRAMPPDRVPIVGIVPDVDFYNDEYADICHGKKDRSYLPATSKEGLYVTYAHGSRGFTSCFLSAEIIAAQINNEPVPVSQEMVEYLSPSRFIVNDLKRR